MFCHNHDMIHFIFLHKQVLVRWAPIGQTKTGVNKKATDDMET